MKKGILIFLGIIITMQPVILSGQTRPPNDPFASMDNAFNKVDKSFTPEEEYYLGRAVAANILAIYKPYKNNTALTRYLNLICQTLVINSSQPAIYNGYHVFILDSSQINAFATPGGHIFITKGLIETAKSEDDLAAVIAHEISHIILRHGISMVEDMMALEELNSVAGQAAAFTGGQNEATKRLLSFRSSVSDFCDIMIKSGYSQPQEFAADNSAIALLAASGYDPKGLLEILSVLQKMPQTSKEGFFGTHPTPAQRITNAQGVTSRYKVGDTRSSRAARFRTK